MAHHLFLEIKFYWNTIITIYIIYVCFHTTMAELTNFSRDYMSYKAENIYCLVFYRKSAAVPPPPNLDNAV
jgi:hypothetical protein